MVIVSYLTECRICKSDKLLDVISLGEQYITSRFPIYGDFSTPKTSIVLCMCELCGLIQLRETTNCEELYEYEYGYRSGINNTMRTHLKDYNTEMCNTINNLKDGDIVLDAFAGSGTTASAVFQSQVEDNEVRKFILVELEDKVCHKILLPRLQSENIPFRYCTLGEPLFDADGNIADAVSFSDLAAHVFFCETGAPIPKRAVSTSALIGQFETRAIYLLYAKDSAGVASVKKGNVLDGKMLDALPQAKDGITHRVVYAEGCTLSDTRLRKAGVSFKHIPYQIAGA